MFENDLHCTFKALEIISFCIKPPQIWSCKSGINILHLNHAFVKVYVRISDLYEG